MSRSRSKDNLDTAMQSEVFLAVFVVILLFFVVVINLYHQSAETLKKAMEHQQPPLILLDEAEGYVFRSGKAVLSDQFLFSLNTHIAPRIAQMSEQYHCDTVEVFGHADGQQYEYISNRTTGGFDLNFHRGLVRQNVSQVAASSNLELGIVRAGVVVSYLEKKRKKSLLGDIKIIRPYTSGQVIGTDGRIERPSHTYDQPKRRRIEIRLSRSADHKAILTGNDISKSKQKQQPAQGK